MNRSGRAKRNKVIGFRIRLGTAILNVQVQLDKKIVFLIARLQQGKFLSHRDSIRRGLLAADAAVRIARQRKFRKDGLGGVINYRADGHVFRGIQNHRFRVFGDVLEHHRLGDATTAIRQAQLDVGIAQRLSFFGKTRT